MSPTRWLIISLLMNLYHTAAAENWPGWRGPRGDGTVLDTNVPTRWNESTGENIRWKTPLPGQGYSSPIVWDDAIFLTACLPETSQRILMRLDRNTGQILWQQAVITCPLETKHKLNSYASGTPATDGEFVYVAFLEIDGRTIDAPNVGTPRDVTPGTMVVAAYDFDGHQKWIAQPGQFISVHGFCSCPVLFENLVIVNGDHDGDGYLVALDRHSGSIAWKSPRPHNTRSYVTPLLREIDGRMQLVLSGSKGIAGVDPRTGETIWNVEGPTEQYVASMVYDGSRFYMAAGFPTYHVMAIDPRGTGDVTDTHVVWHVTTAKCYVPSPVVIGNYLLVPDDQGIANCFDTATGERLWRERLGRHFSASLLAVGELAYFLADDGKMTVLKPGPTATVVSQSYLNEDFYASPAVADGQLFLRGSEHLYCIEQLPR